MIAGIQSKICWFLFAEICWFYFTVYNIPLGGNKKYVYRNLAIVFLLTGVWHGASWNFILWGIFNGAFILLERYFKEKNKLIKNKQSEEIEIWWKKALKHIYALLVINFGWVLFRAPNLSDAVRYIGAMFGRKAVIQSGLTVFWYLDRWTLLIFFVSLITASAIPVKIYGYIKKYMPEQLIQVAEYIILLVMLLFSMMRIVSGTYNPFIYFQF